MVMDYFDDGTTAITGFSASNCMVMGSFTGRCAATIVATNLSWGDRFGFDTNSGNYRDYINVDLDLTLTQISPPTLCPIVGTFTEHGTLSPQLEISGNTLSATFGSGSGSVTSPLGTATVTGALTGTLPSGTQLVR